MAAVSAGGLHFRLLHVFVCTLLNSLLPVCSDADVLW